MKNPFKFDVEVAGDFFCGRRHEIKELVDYIDNETNIIMFAKRRIGKSSLLKEVFSNHLKANILRTHIDIYSISNVRELYERLVRGIEESLIGFESNLNKLSRLVDSIQNYFNYAKISIIISGKPQLKIESTEKNYFLAIEQLFLSYFEFLKAHNLQAVIAIDEFQKIVSLTEADKIEALLRTIANKRINSSFIFTGSKRNILLGMFNDSARAFFKLGTEFQLSPISKNEFYVWVNDRLKKRKIHIENGAFQHLYAQSDGETRFIQQVCHEVFRQSQANSLIVKKDIISIIGSVIEKKTYNAQLLNRYTAAQQNTLKIIALTNGYKIYRASLLQDNSITKATAQSAIRSLIKDGIIFEERDGQLVFEDIEFKLWLQFDAKHS
ncbi:MAG: AAA family ATPase [Kangiellaceae bacterium]|nr:AAA family ATPase [Kangiellaceae bacterium]